MSSGGTAVLADIGGTNTRVALCEGSRLIEGSVMRYRNAENDGIGAVLKHYLAEKGASVDAACVAVAGSVFLIERMPTSSVSVTLWRT